MGKYAKIIVCALPFAFGISPAYSTGAHVGGQTVSAEISHGGGCRKDSPAGQCCHAGSKPYHCH